MKRWLPLFAVICLLWVAFTGCATSDDSSSSSSDAGGSSDATTDGSGFKNDGGPKSDAAANDSGEEASVVDSGEDGAVVDAGEDSGFDAGFDSGPVDAGPPFDVSAAASLNDVTITVTFDAPPNPTEAATLANYAITGGLTLSNPVLVGNVVTLTTTTQSAISYTVTVTGVTRDADARTLTTNQATFTGIGAFDVSSAVSLNSTTVNVTFDAAPDATSANLATNYSISGGLTVSTAVLSGNVVTLTTSTQTASTFTVTAMGVTRASDGAALAIDHVDFVGHPTFNVLSATAQGPTTVKIQLDAAPNSTNGVVLANYSIPGLTISNVSISGNIVTLTTSAQTATTLSLTVSNVTRASDGEPLTTNTANFTGIAPFDVVSASATSLTAVVVTFDGAVDTTTGGVLTNYSIPGLTISAAAVSGSTVTLTTNTQSSITYTVTVSNVVRSGDGISLTTKSAMFAQAGPGAPSVSNVVVTATSPDNGTIPYNTGTSTVTITGTDFTGITCLSAVKLDDLDGLDVAVGTKPTACSVDSNTQITATFPAGIRTNGSTGWDLIITNAIGTNISSIGKFVPRAGLLISEVLTGTSASATHEFLEIYNPTGLPIDTAALGLKYHTRSSTGGDAGNHPVTMVSGRTLTIASHGFLLYATAASTEVWPIDATYVSAGLVASGSAYLSLSTTSGAKVIDKVGWGGQPVNGYEGSPVAPVDDIATGQSIQRISAATPTTDTDVNSADFNAPSATISPTGSAP